MKKKLGMGMKDLLQLTLDEDIRSQGSGEVKKDKVIADLRKELDKLKAQLKQFSGPKPGSFDIRAGKGTDQGSFKTSRPRMDPDLIFSQGLKKLKKGEFIPALELLNVVLYLDPGHIKALNNSAVILFELELIQQAKDKLNKVLAIDPDNKTARENLQEIQKFE